MFRNLDFLFRGIPYLFIFNCFPEIISLTCVQLMAVSILFPYPDSEPKPWGCNQMTQNHMNSQGVLMLENHMNSQGSRTLFVHRDEKVDLPYEFIGAATIGQKPNFSQENKLETAIQKNCRKHVKTIANL